MNGKNVIQQQLETGKMDMPTMTDAIKDSGTINFSFDIDEKNRYEERKVIRMANNKRGKTTQSATNLSSVTIHKPPWKTYDTVL